MRLTPWIALLGLSLLAACAAPAPTRADPNQGRDWTVVDKNRDGYVSPDEMAVWLKANPGPAAGK